MIINEDDYLSHYGILRRSGRYPWGSGGNAYQNHQGFLGSYSDLRKEGLTDLEIAKGWGISTGELRQMKSIAKNEIKQVQIAQAQRLKNTGMSNTAIGKEMGIPESSVRNLLKDQTKEKADILDSTVNMLKEQVAEKQYIMVGAGVHYQLNVSKTKLDNAIAKLKELGYKIFYLRETQLGTGKETTIKVLARPDAEFTHLNQNRDLIKQINNRSDDGGRSYLGVVPPIHISPRRLAVNYAEDGGAQADGVIYVRPGVEDLSLGGASYAQVRIAVGKDRYLKGMAMYKDDLPDGVDLVFNTNKSKADVPNKMDALKKMKTTPDGEVDVDNPFGSYIKRQITRTKRDGTEVATSAMNIVNEEGDWAKWSRSLSSQVLSKQPVTLAKTQLKAAYDSRLREYERISQLTNPAVRKKLLEEFSDEADSAAVHLKAAALGQRQASHVILPVTSIKPTEVYAPNYKDGERVVLIRYPHAGVFEIPELIVNNRHRESRKLLGQARDAIGIHPDVAEQLSGADFDGDSVLVIPNNQSRIKTAKALKGLQGFDPRSEYKKYDGMKVMDARTKGREMGDISNLITDMTIKGASLSEITRAVKHSMVVIDAEKHELNWKLSAEQNGIRQLKETYQGGSRKGAATLISRAGGEVRIPRRIPRRASEGGPIDPKTGRRMFTETGETYTNKQGKIVPSTQKVKRLSVVDDARQLISAPTGTEMERVYAKHSNDLKALANKARRDLIRTPKLVRSPSAAKAYADQVKSLSSALALAESNTPYERQAQVIGNAVYKQKLKDYPSLDESQKKKIKAQALDEARARVGASKKKIVISDTEWEAIQAGALSPTKVSAILDNADMDRVRELATPRPKRLMTPAKTARAQRMLDSGLTRAEVAQALGVSLTTLDEVTDAKGGENLR